MSARSTPNTKIWIGKKYKYPSYTYMKKVERTEIHRTVLQVTAGIVTLGC